MSTSIGHTCMNFKIGRLNRTSCYAYSCNTAISFMCNVLGNCSWQYRSDHSKQLCWSSCAFRWHHHSYTPPCTRLRKVCYVIINNMPVYRINTNTKSLWHTMIETINALLFFRFQGLLACKLYEFSEPLLQWSAQVPAVKQSIMFWVLDLKKLYGLMFNSHDETLVPTAQV